MIVIIKVQLLNYNCLLKFALHFLSKKECTLFLGNGIRLVNVHFLLNFDNYIQSLKCQLDCSYIE